jgi:hypothetical protein
MKRRATPKGDMKRGNYTDGPCFYCSVQDAGKSALVLGPFALESECRQYAYADSEGAPDSEPGGNTAKHFALVKEAEKRDPKSWFYAWGMAKAPNGYRDGVLNKFLPEADRDMHRLQQERLTS